MSPSPTSLRNTWDEAANRTDGPKMSADDSVVSQWVISTEEDVIIAGHTCTITPATNDKHGWLMS